jgi:GxxExxY protein
MLNNTSNTNEKHILPDLLYKEEVYAIIGAAFETHKTLGVGFLEPVYQEAFESELKNREIPFISQPELQIHYKDTILTKKYRADLVVYNKIIIEIKAIDTLTNIEDAQILNYLKATQLHLGLLINFGKSKLEWKRRVLDPDKKVLSVN